MVLGRIAKHGDGEFRHREGHDREQGVIPKIRNGEGDRFI